MLTASTGRTATTNEMQVWMEAQIGGKAVLTHQYSGLENIPKFTLSMPIHRGLPRHLSAENSDDDLS